MLINDELIHSAWHLCYTQEEKKTIFFYRSESDSNGVIVPGFSTHSDLSISICIAKVRLKSYLFTYQMSGDPITWS